MNFNLQFADSEESIKLSFSNEVVVNVVEHETYGGDYSVTPTREVQMLPTNEKLMAQDVIVQPIPKEYGHVSYDHNTKILRIR